MIPTTISTEFASNAPASCGRRADPVRSVKVPVDKSTMRTDSLQESMVMIQERASTFSCSSFFLSVAQLFGSFLPFSSEASYQPTLSSTAMRSSVETMRFTTDHESVGAAPTPAKPCRGCCLVSGHGSSHDILSTACTKDNWASIDDDCDESEDGKWGPWIAVDGDVLRNPDKLRQFIEESRQQRVIASK